MYTRCKGRFVKEKVQKRLIGFKRIASETKAKAKIDHDIVLPSIQFKYDLYMCNSYQNKCMMITLM